ncbi:hypothetical protein D3C80_1796780 [compost metagenome]
MKLLRSSVLSRVLTARMLASPASAPRPPFSPPGADRLSKVPSSPLMAVMKSLTLALVADLSRLISSVKGVSPGLWALLTVRLTPSIRSLNVFEPCWNFKPCSFPK